MVQELMDCDLYQALDQPERSKSLRWSQRSAADVQTSSPVPPPMLPHLTLEHILLSEHKLLDMMA